MSVQAGKGVLPYGSWPTPITSEVVVAEAVRLAGLAVDGPDVIWSEGRPAEGGRSALVRRSPDGALTELLPEDQNARTAVHEYGGGAWWAHNGVVWFASWRDQRIYRRDPVEARCEPLTPEPALPRGDRYADGSLSPDGAWIVCVREHHPPDERGAVDVRNEIVRLDAHEPSEPEVLVTGADFVSNPRFSPDCRQLCWMEWDHPNMPWDGTRLLVGGAGAENPTLIAGGPQESISEPVWQPDGSLTFISDRSGSDNLWTMNIDGSGLFRVNKVGSFEGNVAWSPDGAWLLFVTTRDGTRDIYRITPKATDMTRFIASSAADDRPDWQAIPG